MTVDIEPLPQFAPVILILFLQCFFPFFHFHNALQPGSDMTMGLCLAALKCTPNRPIPSKHIDILLRFFWQYEIISRAAELHCVDWRSKWLYCSRYVYQLFISMCLKQDLTPFLRSRVGCAYSVAACQDPVATTISTSTLATMATLPSVFSKILTFYS